MVGCVRLAETTSSCSCLRRLMHYNDDHSSSRGQPRAFQCSKRLPHLPTLLSFKPQRIFIVSPGSGRHAWFPFSTGDDQRCMYTSSNLPSHRGKRRCVLCNTDVSARMQVTVKYRYKNVHTYSSTCELNDNAITTHGFHGNCINNATDKRCVTKHSVLRVCCSRVLCAEIARKL